jgi:hypothetical protein
VVAAAVALSLLYVGFIRVFEPDMNQRILVIGVYVIAATAAVCLNAFTLGTATEPARNPERAILPVQHQGKSASDIRESGPDNFEERR